jgi:hypothetical protein
LGVGLFFEFSYKALLICFSFFQMPYWCNVVDLWCVLMSTSINLSTSFFCNLVRTILGFWHFHIHFTLSFFIYKHTHTVEFFIEIQNILIKILQ